MNTTQPTAHMLRALCKDEAAYEQLLQLIPALQSVAGSELFHQLLDLNPQSVTISTLDDGRYLKINPAFSRISGYTADEVIGKTSLELNVWPDPQERDRLVTALKLHGSLEAVPFNCRTKYGDIVYMRFSAAIINWQGLPCVLAIADDHTHIDAMRQQLVDNAARYRMVVEQQSDLICHFLPDTTITFANKPYADFFGLTPLSIVGKRVVDLVPESRVAKIKGYIETLIAERAVRTTEYDLLDVSGRVHRIRSVDRPIWDAEGNLVEVQAVGHDITDTYNAQQALARSEARYRAIVEQQTDFIHRRDGDHRLTFVNQPFATLFGRAPADLVGQILPDLYLPRNADRQAAARQHLDAIWQSGQSRTYEFSLVDARGMRRWIQSTDYPIHDERGHLIEYQAVGRDITERHLMQAALAQSEAHLRAIFENYPYGILGTLNSKLVFTRVEGHIEGLPQLSAAQLLGTPFARILPDAAADIITSDLAMILAGAVDEYTYEYQLDERALSIRFGPLRQDTHIWGLIVLIEDITERQEAQQRAVELAVERERVNLITNFVTTASHEFRTPLSVIGSSAYIAKRTTDPAQRARALERIQAQIDSLNHLVGDLVTMARLDAGEAVSLHPVTIDTLLTLALAQTERIATDHAIQLATDIPPDLPTVYGNTGQLVNALAEVLENAVIYSEAGATVRVQADTSAAQIIIRVIDSGIGIAPEHHTLIFQRFYRVDEARTTRGFGLGLSIARVIINQHGGYISVDSEEGVGTTMTIVLPQHAAH